MADYDDLLVYGPGSEEISVFLGGPSGLDEMPIATRGPAPKYVTDDLGTTRTYPWINAAGVRATEAYRGARHNCRRRRPT